MRRATPTDPDDLVALGLVSLDRGPAESALAADGRPELRRALGTLPVEQRRALVLAAVYGHTAAEIAVTESIPLGTAKTRIRSGMAKLRRAMDPSTSDQPAAPGSAHDSSSAEPEARP